MIVNDKKAIKDILKIREAITYFYGYNGGKIDIDLITSIVGDVLIFRLEKYVNARGYRGIIPGSDGNNKTIIEMVDTCNSSISFFIDSIDVPYFNKLDGFGVSSPFDILKDKVFNSVFTIVGANYRHVQLKSMTTGADIYCKDLSNFEVVSELALAIGDYKK